MFSYTPDRLQQLVLCFSEPRLSRYKALTENDSIKAYELYAWNIALSEALLGPIQGLEVILRNYIHNCLSTAINPFWFNAIHLESKQKKQLEEAQRQCRKGYTPGQIVAELNFGFWIGLLSNKYEMSLWRPYLHTCFTILPKGYSRKNVHKELEKVRMLRNRIAHHEPIFHLDLNENYKNILNISAWLNPVGSEWIGIYSNFSKVALLNPLN